MQLWSFLIPRLFPELLHLLDKTKTSSRYICCRMPADTFDNVLFLARYKIILLTYLLLSSMDSCRRSEGVGDCTSQRRTDIRSVCCGRLHGQPPLFHGSRQSAGSLRVNVVAEERSGSSRRSYSSRDATTRQKACRPLYMQRHQYTGALWRNAAKRHRH